MRYFKDIGGTLTEYSGMSVRPEWYAENGWFPYEGDEPVSSLRLAGETIVVSAPPGPTVEELCYVLWDNFKKYQQKYVDGEDLTLASLMMMQGNVKGKELTFWVQKLWFAYYQQKTLLLGGNEYTDDPAKIVPPPLYTIAQLNRDVLALYGDQMFTPPSQPDDPINFEGEANV